MAQYGIGQTVIDLQLLQNGKWYRLQSQDITLTRETDSPSRLQTTILRDSISPENNDVLKLTIDNGHYMFMGRIINTEHSGDWAEVTAIDQLDRVARFETFHIYQDTRLSDLAALCIKDLGLAAQNPPHIMDSKILLPLRIEDNVPWLDVLLTARDTTKDMGGEKFHFWDDCANFCMHSEEWLSQRPFITITPSVIEDYTYSRSTENQYNEVTTFMGSTWDSNRKFFTAKDTGLVDKIGRINKNQSLQEGQDGQATAETKLRELVEEEVKLTISGCQGDPNVRGGTPMKVNFYDAEFIEREYIRGWFKVSSVTHHFKAGYHNMDMNLDLVKMLNDWDNHSPDWSYPK